MINNILGFEGVWANPFPIANPPKRHKLIIDFSILYYFQFIGLTDSTYYFPFFRSFESVTTFTVRYFRYTRSDRVIFQGNLIQSFHNFLVSCAGIFLFVRIRFIINQKVLFQIQSRFHTFSYQFIVFIDYCSVSQIKIAVDTGLFTV